MTPQIDRRDFLKAAGTAAAVSALPRLRAEPGVAQGGAYDWIRQTRIVIAEGYNPPFYPAFDYRAERAVEIARALNGDALRYPAAAYYAFFPTKSGYPVHPELKGDPMRETIDRCRAAGLRTVAYVPMNHPFMDVTANDPRYADWSKKFADGSPMTTTHYGYATYYEGCLNSPVREVIRELVREIVTNYEVDVVFFDGPYEGMVHAKDYCHCRYCQAAYRKRFNRGIPNQDEKPSRDDEVRYTQWMANDVAIHFLAEIRAMIRSIRDVPVLFNDTSLLSRREWRSRAVPVVDGFMFEAAETPEDKLFNLQLGRSTGREVWTYVGTHTQYNREHLKDDKVRGWFSYPVEAEELLLDGATAIAGGAGMLYWSMARFFYERKPPLEWESGRHVKEIFDFQQRHAELLRSATPRPQVGMLIGSQTIDWYGGKHFVGKAYENAFHGAYKLLKSHSWDAEPFLDWQMTPEKLARFPVVYAPNAVCLSDAQCAMLAEYVRGGGRLIATHLTSVADEFGRVRKNFGLAELFGASFVGPEPIEMPDLYLRFPSGDEIPQDPQVLPIRATGAEVVAETFDRGHRRNLGPAVVRRVVGRGEVIYIGSSLEAIYEETLMPPVRDFIGSLLEPWLGALRTYDLEFRPGVMPHLVATDRSLLLHLLADLGNKNKHLRAREWFSPIADVRMRIRVPQGSSVRSVRLLRSGQDVPADVRDGWVQVTVPRLWIHEAVRVDLA